MNPSPAEQPRQNVTLSFDDPASQKLLNLVFVERADLLKTIERQIKPVAFTPPAAGPVTSVTFSGNAVEERKVKYLVRQLANDHADGIHIDKNRVVAILKDFNNREEHRATFALAAAPAAAPAPEAAPVAVAATPAPAPASQPQASGKKSKPEGNRKNWPRELTTESEHKLCNLLFDEQRGLGKALAGHFGVQVVETSTTTIDYLANEFNHRKFTQAFDMLSGMMAAGTHIDMPQIDRIVGEIKQAEKEALKRPFNASAGLSVNHTALKTKTPGQEAALAVLDSHAMNILTGPAGSGKTHLAMIAAVKALMSGEVKRLIFARPAVQAGEKMGELPGEIENKQKPWLLPLYDILDQVIGQGKYEELLEKRIIEIVPVGFMRGRTFNDAFVILDEAQNCTEEQLQMAQGRLGETSRMIITGDPAQVDLPARVTSGLKTFLGLLEQTPPEDRTHIGSHTLTAQDIVRHPAVKQMLGVWARKEPSNQPDNKVVSFPASAAKQAGPGPR